jgi:acyl-coenzyme A synthetase/AMP-(fatty) acid ligase
MMSLWDALHRSSGRDGMRFHGPAASLAPGTLATASTIPGLGNLTGRAVLLTTGSQLATAAALLELDGHVRRMVLCTPDLAPDMLAEVAAAAQTDAVVAERADVTIPGHGPALVVTVTVAPTAAPPTRRAEFETEWILLTSGTSGRPKLVVHTLESLAGALPHQATVPSVWSTFYDIRRYGGLQIYLRAVLSGTSLVLSDAGEAPTTFLARAGAAGVTHISGTPSHWRRALMSGGAHLIDPAYVRLSGEVADQVLLDGLRDTYPRAQVAHAFASTEAGVAFDVTDGRAGFPADYVESGRGGVAMKVIDGTLRIRSARTAARYLGDAPPVVDAAGFVDTGDLVELRDGRYYFLGRRGGVVNVGGQKVFPEEVEAVLNTHPRVRMSLVGARRNPITGAVVVADVVLIDAAASAESELTDLKRELLDSCRRALAQHKVPAVLKFVESLPVTPAGKLRRPGA